MTASKCLEFVMFIMLCLGLKVIVLIKMLHYVEISRNYLCFISQVLRCTVRYITLHYITVYSSECQLLTPVKNTTGKFYIIHT